MGRVEGKVAVVTGVASGVGRATARLLPREGAAVVVAAALIFALVFLSSGWLRALGAIDG